MEKSFFEQAMGLCQDTDACVREAMASQLGNFARKVGATAVEDTLVGELAELLKDEDSSVRARPRAMWPLLAMPCPPPPACFLLHSRVCRRWHRCCCPDR